MKSYTGQFEQSYRRGVILGLSLGEIFIILLFIVLLAFSHLANQQKQHIDDLESQLQNLVEKIKKLGKPIEEIDFTRLVKSLEDNTELQRLVDELQPIVTMAKPLVNAMNKKNVGLEEQAAFLENLASNIIRTDDQKVSEMLEAVKDPEVSAKIQQTKRIAELIDKTGEQADQLNQAEEQIATLSKKVEQLGLEKGQLPPCWYQTIQTDQGNREKEIKIFDILMMDEALIVVMRKKSEKQAKVNLGNLSNLPRLQSDMFDRNITYGVFTEKFRPFLETADQKLIQSYRCRFHVGVWDRTTNKIKYKNRLAVIENIFFKYEFKTDPWPHGP